MTNLLFIALFLGLFHTKKVPLYIHVGIAIVLGLFAVIYATWWIHPSFHDFRYFESDFLDYCYTLTTYEQPLSENGSAYRSRFAGLSAYMLKEQFGTIDAIAVSSLIWTGVCFGLIYLIATQLQNSTAGLFAVMFALSIAPLHTMGRLVNFYPTIIACMLSGGFCFVLWSSKNTLPRTFLLGCSLAALFLIDLRGVLWASMYWFGAVCWMIVTVPKRNWLRTIVILHLPIIVAWYLGPWAYPPNTTSIEQQTSFVYREFISGPQHVHNKKIEGYVWGRTGLYSIVELFMYLFEQAQREAPNLTSHVNSRDKFQYDKSMHILLYYAVLTCILLRHPRRSFVFIVCVLPFGLAWKGVTDAKDFQLRLYAQAAPIFPIALGVAIGNIQKLFPVKIRVPRIIFYPTVCMIAYRAMMGTPPNPYAIGQSWHPNWYPKADELNRINELVLEGKGVKIRDRRLVQCYEQILKEKQPWVRTYGYISRTLKPLKPPQFPRK